MDFQFTAEQEALKAMVLDFAEQQILPKASVWDAKAEFPIELLKAAAALGMAGIIVPEALGGSGLGPLESALIFEQLAKACVSTSTYLSVHNMVTSTIAQYASQALQQRFVPKLCAMDAFASYCLTEPESGSDAASLKSTARLEADHYIVNGCKAFISGGSVSDVYLCMLRTGDDSHHGISALLIEKDTPGLSFGSKEHKLGWRNQPTCMVYFENCRVPVQNLVGEPGQGFKIALNALNRGRVNIAASSLGGAAACLKATHRYMQERRQFDHCLSEMQALRFRFADMVQRYEAARWLVYRAANSLERKEEQRALHCALAKRAATDAAFFIANQALQLHGGYGLLEDYQIERYLRDLRVNQIVEGSNEIMLEIISKTLFAEESFCC